MQKKNNIDSTLETLLQSLDTEVREVPNYIGSVYLTLKEFGKTKEGRNNTQAFLNGPLAMAKIGEGTNNSLVISVALNEEEYIVVVVHSCKIDLKVVKKNET
jgi:hypothetical protein